MPLTTEQINQIYANHSAADAIYERARILEIAGQIDAATLMRNTADQMRKDAQALLNGRPTATAADLQIAAYAEVVTIQAALISTLSTLCDNFAEQFADEIVELEEAWDRIKETK